MELCRSSRQPTLAAPCIVYGSGKRYLDVLNPSCDTIRHRASPSRYFEHGILTLSNMTAGAR